MSCIKEAFLNNIPYREKFDDYGRTRTTNPIHKTGITLASQLAQTTPWDSAKIANVAKYLGSVKTGVLC